MLSFPKQNIYISTQPPPTHMEGGGRRALSGKPAKPTITCMPRLRKCRGGSVATPMSLLERFREVVLRFIMLSAVSKAATATAAAQTSSTDRASVVGASVRREPDSHRSEAVEDCIEFFKRSSAAEAKSSGAVSDDEEEEEEEEDREEENMEVMSFAPAALPVVM